MSTALTTIQEPGGLSLSDTMTLGEVLWKSGVFPDCKSAAQAVVKILAGREFGFSPMASLTGVHFIEGKPSIGAHLLAAAIQRSGKYKYRLVKCDRESCELQFLEKNGDGWEAIGNIGMTIKDAEEQGLTVSDNNKPKRNWVKHPDDMLFARCISKGYRRYCPDLSGGQLVYVTDELEAEQTETLPTVKAEEVKQIQQERTVIDQAEQAELSGLLQKTGTDLGKFLAFYAVPSIDQFPSLHLFDARSKLQAKIIAQASERVHGLITDLGINETEYLKEVQQKYNVTTWADLTITTLDQIEADLKSRKASASQGKPAA